MKKHATQSNTKSFQILISDNCKKHLHRLNIKPTCFINPILTAFFLFPNLALSQTAKKTEALSDVTYNFDTTKIKASADAFHFLRSFVDYFYLTYKANENKLTGIASLSETKGWCVGDAHAENFGVVLLENQKPIFTMNDVDDSGPCPVAVDLYRFLVSSKLYDSTISTDQVLSAYLKGLQNKKMEQPLVIQNMINKAIKKGILPNDKKVIDFKIVRDNLMTEILPADEVQIEKILKKMNSALSKNFKVIDLVSTSKVGGGSGGLQRYEVLIDNDGTPLHLELKEEVVPSIYPVAAKQIPKTAERIATTLTYDQGKKASSYYQVVQINNKDMLIRPRFAGNIGVSLERQTLSENVEIIQYEAFVLGSIHSGSIKNKDLDQYILNLKKITSNDLAHDVDLMRSHFLKKYTSLTQP